MASPSPMSRSFPIDSNMADMVGIKTRPSSLPKYIPSTIFFDYPTDMPNPITREDTFITEYFAPNHAALIYKAYWTRTCIKNVFKHNGFVKKTKSSFCVLWSKHVPDEDLKHLEAYQKVNHFPNSWCVGRKDRLSRLLSQFKRNNGTHNNNHPNNKVYMCMRMVCVCVCVRVRTLMDILNFNMCVSACRFSPSTPKPTSSLTTSRSSSVFTMLVKMSCGLSNLWLVHVVEGFMSLLRVR
ncbi:hypothetical protein EON65_52220 [archaeon]|nr:MAG: hypothetical protein EON65_52220 [archaeon]